MARMEKRPFCKVCEAHHFAREPHQFKGDVKPVKLESPRPTPKVIHGAKFVAEIPEGTKLTVFDGKVIASGPNIEPSIVTENGLVPIEANGDGIVMVENKIIAGLQEVIDGKIGKVHRRGRPATGFDKKAYDKRVAKERRDAKKAQRLKEGKTE